MYPPISSTLWAAAPAPRLLRCSGLNLFHHRPVSRMSSAGVSIRRSFFRSNIFHRRTFRDQIIRRPYSSYGRPDPPRPGMRAVWVLIGLNTAVFAFWQHAIHNKDRRLLNTLTRYTTCSWQNIQEGRYITLITSAFSHIDLGHFAFNMMAFFTFGNILSFIPGIGPFHIIAISIGGAIASSMSWLVHTRSRAPPQSVHWNSYAQQVTRRAAQGASGIVMAAGAVATCLAPSIPMNLFFIPIPIPLWVITFAYAGLDMFYLNSESSRIGHAAHLGGSIFGIMYYMVYLRRYGGLWAMLRRTLRR